MSIFDGTAAIINNSLFQHRSFQYQQLAALRLLGECDVICADSATLVRSLYEHTVNRWREANSNLPRVPSKQNWRFTVNTMIRLKNPSREKQVEKRIAALAEEGRIGLDEWANQVPIASGLLDRHKDKKSCVDLVHRAGPGRYDIIELKMNPGSGHVVFAAMEALRYGILFLFSKRWAGELGYSSDDALLLGAKYVRLIVLGPAEYYRGVPQTLLRSLRAELNAGLASEIAREGTGETAMELDFEEFPPSFSWPCSDDELISALLGRRRTLGDR